MQDPSLQEGAAQQQIDQRLDGAEPPRECPACGADLDAPAFVNRRGHAPSRRLAPRRNNRVKVRVSAERRERPHGRRDNAGRRRARPDY